MISTLPVSPGDQAFLLDLYATTRSDELAAWGWDAAQQAAFLRMQFLAQQQSYQWQYPDMDYRVILADGRQVGRIIVWRSPSRIQLVDISLLPDCRGQGIGSALLRDLQAEAARERKPLALSVLKTNAGARRLYERSGFRANGEHELYITMVWQDHE